MSNEPDVLTRALQVSQHLDQESARIESECRNAAARLDGREGEILAMKRYAHAANVARLSFETEDVALMSDLISAAFWSLSVLNHERRVEKHEAVVRRIRGTLRKGEL
ncbi:MAG: hypothetical protein H0T47_09620 [Planctomycetaceae bacterium]|nr:hypothetical protein [Planctomycetaceae bacterium]